MLRFMQKSALDERGVGVEVVWEAHGKMCNQFAEVVCTMEPKRGL